MTSSHKDTGEEGESRGASRETSEGKVEVGVSDTKTRADEHGFKARTQDDDVSYSRQSDRSSSTVDFDTQFEKFITKKREAEMSTPQFVETHMVALETRPCFIHAIFGYQCFRKSKEHASAMKTIT